MGLAKFIRKPSNLYGVEDALVAAVFSSYDLPSCTGWDSNSEPGLYVLAGIQIRSLGPVF